MTAFVQAASTYFFNEEPKQIFVGVELCARWVVLLKGHPVPPSIESVIAYCQNAQEIFSWVLAGKSMTSLAGRVVEKKWDAETVVLFSGVVSHAAACGDIMINKLFESKIPYFKLLGFAADAVADLVEIKMSATQSSSNISWVGLTAVASFCLTSISVGAYFGFQNRILPVASLVFEFTVFVAKIGHFNKNFAPNK